MCITKFNYSKLKGRITERCETQRNFARKLGRTEAYVSGLLSGKAYFSQKDIDKSCELLEIPQNSIGEFFFTKEVHKSETNIREVKHYEEDE